MKSLLYRLLFFISCAIFSLNSFADNHKKTMWDVITNDSRFATFAVMVEKAGVENFLMERSMLMQLCIFLQMKLLKQCQNQLYLHLELLNLKAIN